MKNSFTILALTFFLFSACGEDEEVKATKLLTSKTWVPQTLKMPDNIGYWGGPACEDSFRFHPENNNLTRKSDCISVPISGKWTWSKIGQEIFIDYQGNMLNNQKIKVLQLSDTLLHTIERNEDDKDDGSNNYWEKKYRPRI